MKTIESSSEGWDFTFHQAGLACSQEIQSLAVECKLFRPPTIIFSKNQCIIKERQAGIVLTYNAREALRFINYQRRQESYVPPAGQPQPNTISFIPQKLYVKHAQHWKSIQKPKDIEITEIHESSDSFFLNTFKGHIDGKVTVQRVFDNVIPLEKLGPTNPITFYFQGSMYEDELDDNGLIQYEYKFRTMSQSWFGLIRSALLRSSPLDDYPPPFKTFTSFAAADSPPPCNTYNLIYEIICFSNMAFKIMMHRYKDFTYNESDQIIIKGSGSAHGPQRCSGFHQCDRMVRSSNQSRWLQWGRVMS